MLDVRGTDNGHVERKDDPDWLQYCMTIVVTKQHKNFVGWSNACFLQTEIYHDLSCNYEYIYREYKCLVREYKYKFFIVKV